MFGTTWPTPLMDIQAYVYITAWRRKEECTGGVETAGHWVLCFISLCVCVYKTCILCLSVCVYARGCMFILAVSSGLLLCAPVNTCTGLYKRACIGAAFKTKTLGCKGK